MLQSSVKGAGVFDGDTVSAGSSQPQEDSVSNVTVTADQFRELYQKVNNCVRENVVVINEMSEESDITLSKHARQHKLLLNQIVEREMIHQNSCNCFVEMGCGKAKFSDFINNYLVAKAKQNLTENETKHKCDDRPLKHRRIESIPIRLPNYILIDRMKFRSKKKADHHIRGTIRKFREFLNEKNITSPLQGGEVFRITDDIRNVSVNKIQEIQKCGSESNLIFTSKHLCGPALELALRCASEASQNKYSTKVVFGTCCHHLLSYNTCYKNFFDVSGFSANDVDVMAKATSWATLSLKTKHHSSDEKKKEVGENKAEMTPSVAAELLPLKREEMKQFGRNCKLLFDYSRTKWLRDVANFTNVAMVKYCSTNITPENIAIVASSSIDLINK
eukprot:g5261.t1